MLKHLKHLKLEPLFVKGVPRELEPGVLYVSMEYATVVHSCCCGCGLEVVTQLSPSHWELSFDGEAVSLWPSVGNWNLPCRSHYVIRKNQVLEAGPWSKEKVLAAQQREQKARDKYYAQRQPAELPDPIATRPPVPAPKRPSPRFLARWISSWAK